MQYYAKVNTAHPATGFITTGEVLTEKQARALGAEKIAELIERGVLAACGENPQAAPSAAPATPPEAEEETPDQPEEDDGELDELDVVDEIVTDEAPADKPDGSRENGRKKK